MRTAPVAASVHRMVSSLDGRTTTGAVRVRPIDPDDADFPRWLDVTSLQFRHSATAHPDLLAFVRADRDGVRRTAAVDDADRIVGTYRSWDTGLTVPGGATVRVDAISSVTVDPTYRRRGALTAMIMADLADAAERGMPAAILIASQAPIYGRFGFAPATQTASWEVDRATARLSPGPRPSGSIEVLAEAGLRSLAPEVYARCRRPGAIDRSERYWDLRLGLVTWPGETHTTQVGVLYRDAQGTPQGFALWHAKEDWENRINKTVATVDDLEAATDEAYLALWSHLLDLDLVATLRSAERAVDEPLPWLLEDGRHARLTSRVDFQWSRLLDPAAALSARTYAVTSVAVAFEVGDPQGWAAGTYLLEVDDTGVGRCTRTSRRPQVGLDVTALSSAWLGGGDLRACRVAGTAVEHEPGALDRLTVMLRTARAPWTATWF